MDIKLTDDEIKMLRLVLQSVAIRARTGDLGIMHGMNRFVSTNRSFKKEERETLDSAAKKLGLGGVSTFSG